MEAHAGQRHDDDHQGEEPDELRGRAESADVNGARMIAFDSKTGKSFSPWRRRPAATRAPDATRGRRGASLGRGGRGGDPGLVHDLMIGMKQARIDHSVGAMPGIAPTVSRRSCGTTSDFSGRATDRVRLLDELGKSSTGGMWRKISQNGVRSGPSRTPRPTHSNQACGPTHMGAPRRANR
jgi:hypothetical protein